ncbi:DUF6350 family protein [Xylanimonas ulmi]|uniref:Uncharacterized protein n=1 Tax=Xylanimonas ulmi TaxID=228973 RepID=A0A4Q7M7Z4_9MICO|nr:DUF6350 family protein [Xylanibacterium ulmi]RZS63237.1 hypothetical protein EV386_3600 [Xylanibacterium ulmi]
MSPSRTSPRTTARPTPGAVDARALGPARTAPALSGVWSVAQGMVLSFTVVLLLAVVTLLAAPDAGAARVPWATASRVAQGLWLLGHGVPVGVGDATVTIVPLGIGALALFTTYVSAKRSAIGSLSAVVTGALAYLAVVLVAAAGAGARDGALALAAVGALVVGGGGMAMGVLTQPEAPRVADVTERLFGVLPPVARLGVRAGFVALALLVALSAAIAAVWMLAGRGAVNDMVGALAPGWIGGVVLAVSQVALVPNLVAWAAAWTAGPGFAVGVDTAFSPREVIDGPLPAMPLLAALPRPDWTGAHALWAPALVVLCGALAGWFAWRRLEPSRVGWADLAWVLGGMALTAGLGMAVLQLWAGGAAGAGRLAVVGADPLVAGGFVAVEVLLGGALVLLTAHERPWRHVTSR